MTINELSKELDITNKELITLLKAKGYQVSSHLQKATDEMVDTARDSFKQVASETPVVEEPKIEVNKTVPVVEEKTYLPDDMIPCKSVTPWKIYETGIDKVTVYAWSGFGDIVYVSFKDLQYLKRRDVIKDGMIVIDDPVLYTKWAKELGSANKYFLGVDYPEEFFDLPDSEFEGKLKESSETYKEVIKYTAINMIHAQNYPTLQKLIIIDNVLGTCIKDFAI